MSSYKFWAGDEAPTHFQPGDFLLTRTNFSWRSPGSFDGPMIRLGERRRFGKKYSWANHAAMVVSEDGCLIEALARGVVCSNAEKYRSLDYYLVDPFSSFGTSSVTWHPILAKELRQNAVLYAHYMLKTKYAWLSDVSLGLNFLTGSRFNFGRALTINCSGLVAAALGEDKWRADPSHVTPAELAAFYDIDFTEVRK